MRPRTSSVPPRRRASLDRKDVPRIPSLSIPMRATVRRLYTVAEVMVCLRDRYGCPSKAPNSEEILLKFSHFFYNTQQQMRAFNLSEKDLLGCSFRAMAGGIVQMSGWPDHFYPEVAGCLFYFECSANVQKTKIQPQDA